MTAQAGERLRYKNEDYSMATEPLGEYLFSRKDINFVFSSTACWRGYIGSWEIADNKLYLIGLEAYIDNYKEVDLGYVFPNQDKVFAYWFSGHIRVPTGKMIEYVHMGYNSIFEKDLILEFREGVLISEKEIDNR